MGIAIDAVGILAFAEVIGKEALCPHFADMITQAFDGNAQLRE